MSIAQEVPALSGRIKQLVNEDLRKICRAEGLPVSGVKSTLQGRILSQMDRYVQDNNIDGFTRLRYRVTTRGGTPPTPNAPQYNSHSSPVNPNYQNGYSGQMANGSTPSRPQYTTRLRFKDSPFYEIDRPLTPTQDLTAVPNHRNAIKMSLTLPPDVIDLLKNHSSYRIMLYCTTDPQLDPFSRSDVTFPHQIEIKINGDEVKANLKGLKNKPGSTRPADVTEMVQRKVPNYRNELTVTYALTQKKHQLVVMLVRKHSVENLTERIGKASRIAKHQTIKEMINKANDPDIVATSTVMSLKDPISTLRINTPCRSHICNHNQCFDAESFLQLQEQAPTWTCPVCNKQVSFAALAVDEYVQDILQKTSRSIDQVTIEPDGNWQPITQENSSGRKGANKSSSYGDDDDDDSDDLVEIADPRVTHIKSEAAATPFLPHHTPPLSSRASSTTIGSGAARGTKRTSEVIDLTLSDDDEPPVRPGKRPAYSTPNSLPDAHGNGYSSSSAHSSSVGRPPNGIAPYPIPHQPRQPPLHASIMGRGPGGLQLPSRPPAQNGYSPNGYSPNAYGYGPSP